MESTNYFDTSNNFLYLNSRAGGFGGRHGAYQAVRIGRSSGLSYAITLTKLIIPI
jgi:hypothetical protein